MDIKKLIEFLKANNATPEIIQFVETLKQVDLDTVKGFLEKDEAGKKHIQSLTDAAVTKGLATFKEKTFPTLLEDEIKKRYPDETKEQKEMRELKQSFEQLQKDNKRKDLLNKATQIAIEKKLPLKLVEKLVGEDEESTTANLGLLESEYTTALTAAVAEKFKEGGREPGSGNPEPLGDLDKLSDTEFFAARQKK